MYMDWWAWVPMMIGMILFWGLVAWLAIRLIVGGREPAGEPSEVTAREILDTRLARGEIDAAEYEEARSLLEADAVAPTGGDADSPASGRRLGPLTSSG
jgi:uncharacterized membrane protein